MGTSGGSTGTHLHFEVRQSPTGGQSHLAPYDWLYSGGVVRAIGRDGVCATPTDEDLDFGED